MRFAFLLYYYRLNKSQKRFKCVRKGQMRGKCSKGECEIFFVDEPCSKFNTYCSFTFQIEVISGVS